MNRVIFLWSLSFGMLFSSLNTIIGGETDGRVSDTSPWMLVLSTSALTEDADDPDRFIPTKMLDGDPATCWAEGGEGDGEGEIIGFGWSAPVNLSGLTILPGFARDEQIWLANGRPKTIEVFLFSENSPKEYMFSLNDEMSQQSLLFPEGVVEDVERLNIIIEEVFPGDKFDDTCISEITFIYDNFLSEELRVIYPNPKPTVPPQGVENLVGADFFPFTAGASSVIWDFACGFSGWSFVDLSFDVVFVGSPKEVEENLTNFLFADEISTEFPDDVELIALIHNFIGRGMMLGEIWRTDSGTLVLSNGSVLIPAHLTPGAEFNHNPNGYSIIVGWEELDHPIGDDIKTLHIREYAFHETYDTWWTEGYGEVLGTESLGIPFFWEVYIPSELLGY